MCDLQRDDRASYGCKPAKQFSRGSIFAFTTQSCEPMFRDLPIGVNAGTSADPIDGYPPDTGSTR